MPQATGLLLGSSLDYSHFLPFQVHSWTRKAPSCGFHLVPVPVSPFPDHDGRNVDPFRLPVFIPLNFANCTVDGCELFEGTSNICHEVKYRLEVDTVKCIDRLLRRI